MAKTNEIRIRISPEWNAIIDQMAALCKVSRNEFVRARFLDCVARWIMELERTPGVNERMDFDDPERRAERVI